MARPLDCSAIETFAADIEVLDDPNAVLAAMQAIIAPIKLYAVWRAPINRSASAARYTIGHNIWLHGSVPDAYWTEFWPVAKARGISVFAEHALLTQRFMCFSEARNLLKPIGQQRWITDLMRAHGLREVCYAPIGRWIVGFWSPTPLLLAPMDRSRLYMLANYCAFQMDGFMRRDDKRPTLTRREISVLRLASRGRRAAAIAQDLSLSPHTVREYLDQATKKLRARSPMHAACQALRLHLIS